MQTLHWTNKDAFSFHTGATKATILIVNKGMGMLQIAADHKTVSVMPMGSTVVEGRNILAAQGFGQDQTEGTFQVLKAS